MKKKKKNCIVKVVLVKIKKKKNQLHKDKKEKFSFTKTEGSSVFLLLYLFSLLFKNEYIYRIENNQKFAFTGKKARFIVVRIWVNKFFFMIMANSAPRSFFNKILFYFILL